MKISHDTKRENSTSPKKQDQRCLCRLREEFGVRGFMAQKMVVKHSQKKRILEDSGALPREHRDLLRDDQAMHADNFLSS